MIEVYKYLNGHSIDIMNDIFKLIENMYNLRNYHIFQTENPRSLKDSMLFHIVLANSGNRCLLISRKAASLALFKNRIKTWKCKDYPCRSCKIFIQNVGYI